MKKLLLSLAILMLFAASCTTGKSFLKQRYTSYGHKKHHVNTEKTEYAKIKKQENTITDEPMIARTIAINATTAETPADLNTKQPVLTANAASEIKQSAKAPAITKNMSFTNNRINSFAKHNFSKLSDSQVKKDQTRRGLLFGIINDLLSIILIIILVAIIIFLILVLF